jgi:hypothetical protein
MHRRMTGTLFSGLLFAGCGSSHEPAQIVQPALVSQAPIEPIRGPPPPTVSPPASGTAHRVTRTIDKDPDGDGIANYRIIITEVFDKSGMLLERIREDDFEADGIVDARNVTTFDD